MTGKSIIQFLPLAGQSRRAADRYYRDVHTRFSRGQMRTMPHVLSYHTNRADAEYDLTAGWRQRPRAFRFAILRFTLGHGLEFPPEVRAQIIEDHRLFLRELRDFAVEEQAVVDRLGGQTGLVKYLFEFERPEEAPLAEGESTLSTLVHSMAREAADAFGLRRVLVDRVRSEAVAEAIDEPGQRLTDRTLPQTTKQAFLELWFDNHEWAEEWFARPVVRAVLRDPWWAVARGYRVTEECQLDRTTRADAVQPHE